MYSGNDDKDEMHGRHTGRLKTGATDQESVDIGLLGELLAVLLTHRATVDDTGVLGSLGGDGVAEPLADGSVNVLGLLGGSNLASSNSPVYLLVYSYSYKENATEFSP